ncbi:enoyl-CoA delta isomerase 3 [Cryptomeria japonica]|uniref:enoyl-CoA delta isomerase 3 n=1 Tax=Cryptomeria japonica TaxID=3369 RepID=UPI0027DA018C|nr:enoyl-CoA delta isomerase 3 [Cryptomeria japonica]
MESNVDSLARSVTANLELCLLFKTIGLRQQRVKETRELAARICTLEKRGKVYILTLVGDNEEDEHRLNPTSFDAIANALKEVEQSPDAAALVTTNAGKYFSCGIDMNWIGESPHDRMDVVLEKLENMLASFMRLNVPTVAAIRGRAVSGAYMLALAHDYRFMTQGSGELYMCELDLGLPIPKSMLTLIRSKLQPATLRDVVLRASELDAQMAFEKGIVDGVFEDKAGTLEGAVKEAEKLAARGWEREIYRGFRLATFPGVAEALDINVPYRVPASFKF